MSLRRFEQNYEYRTVVSHSRPFHLQMTKNERGVWLTGTLPVSPRVLETIAGSILGKKQKNSLVPKATSWTTRGALLLILHLEFMGEVKFPTSLKACRKP